MKAVTAAMLNAIAIAAARQSQGRNRRLLRASADTLWLDGAAAGGQLITKYVDSEKWCGDERINDLSQKGYLATVRGRSGGIRLMREPRDINIGQVVRDTETQLGVVGCLEHKGYCPIERVCVLRGALHNATAAFLAVLDAHTLADLIKPAQVLSSLLLE